MNRKPDAAWLQHLTEAEQAEVATLDEMLAMHRKLMAPIIAERARIAATAQMRRLRERDRAGARRDAA